MGDGLHFITSGWISFFLITPAIIIQYYGFIKGHCIVSGQPVEDGIIVRADKIINYTIFLIAIGFIILVSSILLSFCFQIFGINTTVSTTNFIPIILITIIYIYPFLRLSQAILFILIQNLNFIDATKKSWSITKNRIIEVIIFNICVWLSAGLFIGILILMNYTLVSLLGNSDSFYIMFIGLNFCFICIVSFIYAPWLYLRYVLFFIRLLSPQTNQHKKSDKLPLIMQLFKLKFGSNQDNNSKENKPMTITWRRSGLLIIICSIFAVIVTLAISNNKNDNNEYARLITSTDNINLSSNEIPADTSNEMAAKTNSATQIENRTEFKSNSIMIVDSKLGLVMRKEPNINAKKIAIIPNKDEIKVIERQLENETINGITSNWVKVSWRRYTAWVFGGYLIEKNDSL